MPRSPSAEVGAASATPHTAGGRSGIGRLVPRLPILGDLRLDRRLGWVIPVFIVLVTAIVGYNARTTAHERGSALVVNIAGRQRTLVERYTKDVLLVVDGFQADPDKSGAALHQTADALLDGGSVLAPQGNDLRVKIPPARDWKVRRKLDQDRRLIDELTRTGDRLLEGGRADPGYAAGVTRLRVLSAQLSSVSNDAVGEITKYTEASLSRLVRIEIALGLLSALAALAMGLLLRRAGAEQAAQFRSLLNIRDVTEQAALRKSIGDLFHNLARRSQGLVDRQLELIDELERGEVDPDRLQELFRMDHLATRMRRNAENLIVLSGVEQRRRWSEPVPLRDVVEAAVAEVEEYSRVQVAGIHDLTLSGQAASDVAHLLAELVENATSFSPPNTTVQISGDPAGSGYVLEVEDRGIGMSDAEVVEANRRLAAPLAADIAVSRMMGFHVVGRLASRYGIKVQLRHSWFGGVSAQVLLPAVLFASAGERPAAAPSAPAGGVVSPDPLLPAEITGSGWRQRAYLPLRRHAAPAPNRGGDTDAPAEAGEPVE